MKAETRVEKRVHPGQPLTASGYQLSSLTCKHEINYTVYMVLIFSCIFFFSCWIYNLPFYTDFFFKLFYIKDVVKNPPIFLFFIGIEGDIFDRSGVEGEMRRSGEVLISQNCWWHIYPFLDARFAKSHKVNYVRTYPIPSTEPRSRI